MIRLKTKQDPLPKTGASRREEMSTLQVKNTILHLNGQNLKLEAKNGDNLKAPGPHLSPVHGKKAVGRLTASPQLTHEGTSQLDLVLPKSPKPVVDKGGENLSLRRPLKLAPLELSEEVRQAQKQKLKSSHDVKAGNKPGKVKTCVNQGREKVASIEQFKVEKRPPKPQLTSLEEVVCQGTPAPLFPKLTPNSLSPHIKARGRVTTGQNLSGAHQDSTGKRRLRLTRAQCLEEDEAKSNMSTAGLCPHEDKSSQSVQGKGQRADRAPRGTPQSGKGIRELPVVSQEKRCARKSNEEDRGPRSDACTLNPAADGSSELEGVKLSASNWRLKRKKALITKHNKTVTLERLEL